MAANELIDHLEMWGTFDKAMIKKLRHKVKNTPKEPTAQALLNYLVKKGVISTTESEDLLTKYLNDPGQDSAVLLQEDLANPEVDLEEVADNETVMDMGNFSFPGNSEDEKDKKSSSGSEEEFAYSAKYRKETNWGSVWIWVGSVSIAALSIIIIGLYHFLTTISADEMYDRGANAYKKSAHADARKKLTDFLEKYGANEKASDAIVMKALCEVYVPYTNRSYSVALKKAEEELPEITTQTAFAKYTDDLADLLPSIAKQLAESARKSRDFDKKREFQQKAKDAMVLVNKSSYIPTKKRTGIANVLGEIEESLATVDRQLSIEETKTTAIAEIQKFIEEGKTTDAYNRYRKLVSSFPELDIHADVRKIREVIRDKESTLVKASDCPLQPSADAQSISDVLLVSNLGKRMNVSDQIPISIITDATLYSLQASTGKPLWRSFLGYKFHYHPVEVKDSNSIDWIVSRSVDNSVALVESMTGKVKWTVKIGEPFLRPVLGNGFVIVSTNSGKIHKLNLATGQGEKTATLPQPISAPGAMMSKGSFLYQPGDHWFMYVIDTRDMECKETVLLFHESGSIQLPPVSLRDFLYIAESHPANSKVHILNWKKGGRDFEKPQPAYNFPGSIRTEMISFGRGDVLVVDDSGKIDLLSNIGEENQRPVQKSLTTTYDPVKGVIFKPSIAKSGDLFLSGKGLTHLVLSKARGKIDTKPAYDQTAVFMEPVEFVEDAVIHTRRRLGNAIFTVTAADQKAVTARWTADLGSSLAGSPFQFDGKNWAINSIGDLFEFSAPAEGETSIAKRARQGSITRQSLLVDQFIVSPKGYGLASRSKDGKKFVNFSLPGVSNTLTSRVSSWPSSYYPLSCPPVLMGESAIITSEKGVVGLLKLENGTIAAGGFRPRVPPQTQLHWLPPAVIDSKRFVVTTTDGRAFLLEVVNGGLVKRKEAHFDETKILSPSVAVGMSVLTVTQTKSDQGKRVDSLKILDSEFKEVKSITLGQGYVAGPWVGNSSVLAQGNQNQIYLSDTTLSDLKGVDGSEIGNLIGTPVFEGDKWNAITSNNMFVQIDPESGELVKKVSLNQPLHSGPVNIDGRWLATTRDGAVVYIPNK